MCAGVVCEERKASTLPPSVVHGSGLRCLAMVGGRLLGWVVQCGVQPRRLCVGHVGRGSTGAWPGW